METRRTQNRIMATVNELADFIRKNAPIRFGVVAAKKKIAPSTLYGYVKIMLDNCGDIRYEHGVFTIELHHRMPNGKEVPLER